MDTAKMKAYFKVCLTANLISIVLMFASTIFVGMMARSYHVVPPDNSELSSLASSYITAKRLALFVGLPAFIIAFFGMFRFQSWARNMHALLVLVWGLQILGFGIFNLRLTWGASAIFADLALMTAGAVLAMSYMTPISDLFARPDLDRKSPDGFMQTSHSLNADPT